MIYVIQLIWFIQQFFMFILLMNFVIAIINQSYDVNIEEANIHRYQYKAEEFYAYAVE